MPVMFCALLGAFTGLILPRAAYRLSVPADAPSRSACARCAAPFPRGLSGWVRVPAGCPACGTTLGPPAGFTVPAGALAFAAVAVALGPVPALPAYLLLAGYGLLLAEVDVACRRLPDRLVAAAGAGTVLLLVAATAPGQAVALARAALAGLALGLGYLLVALLPRGPLGMGDVKLAAVLGMALGWAGWPAVLLGALLPYLLAGPVALVLLAAGRVGRRDHLPFGPALLAGALLALLAGRAGPDASEQAELVVAWAAGHLLAPVLQ